MPFYMWNTSNGKCRCWRNSTIPDAFASRLDTILRVPRCQCIEVLSVLTSNRKEVLSFLTSHCKEVLVPCTIQEQATARSCCSYNTHMVHTHRWWEWKSCLSRKSLRQYTKQVWISTKAKYWYFQCTREKRGSSRFKLDSSRFSQDESREKRDASRETVVTYFWPVLYDWLHLHVPT